MVYNLIYKFFQIIYAEPVEQADPGATGEFVQEDLRCWI